MTITTTGLAHTRALARVTGAVLLTSFCVALPCGAKADGEGRLNVQIDIGNATGAALECQALAAHWYSFPVRRLDAGGNVLMSFAYRPERGEVTAEPASRLPVETLYCGLAGRAWATRGEIDVRAAAARAAAAGGRARITCRAAGGAVACAEAE